MDTNGGMSEQVAEPRFRRGFTDTWRIGLLGLSYFRVVENFCLRKCDESPNNWWGAFSRGFSSLLGWMP